MDISHINKILYQEWDPIGVKGAAPENEYESYAEQIVEMIDHGGDRDDILDFLDRSRVQEMMLKSDHQQDVVVVNAIEAYHRSLANIVF